MAEINNIYLETNAIFSGASGSWTIVDDGTISGGSLLANTKYLVIARALLRGTSTSAAVRCRVYSDDFTNLDVGQTRYEMAQVGTDDYKSYFFVHRFTTGGTPADVRFETQSNTAYFSQYSLLLMDLDDLGSGNYVEDISVDPNTELSTTPWGTEIVSIAGADLGTTEEWLVLGSWRVGVKNVSNYFASRLRGADDASTASTLGEVREEGESTQEFRTFSFVGRHKAVGSNVDLAIEAYEEDAAANAGNRGGYLIAIKASAFADFEHDYTAGTVSVGAETTVASVGPYTPSVNGNHLIIGRDERVPGAGLAKLHLEDGTTETRTGDSTPTHNQNWDTVKDQESAHTMQRISISAEKTYNLRATDSTTRDHQNRWLLILNLNLATGGTPATVTPGVVAVVAAVPTPSITAAATVTPGVVAVIAAAPTPVASIPFTVTPDTVVSTTAVPTPTILAASVVTPGVVVTLVAAPTPTIDVAGASLVTPDTVVSTVIVPTPAVLAESITTPGVVAVVAVVPTPSITAAANVTPGVVATAATVPSPTILAASVVTPGVVALLFTVPTPTIPGGVPVSVAPDVVEVVMSVPQVTLVNWHHTLKAGRDGAKFFRMGGDQFVLVTGLSRSAAIGYKKTENWYPGSGVFAVPSTPSVDVMSDVAATWITYKTVPIQFSQGFSAAFADLAVLYVQINAALTANGFVRTDGSAVT